MLSRLLSESIAASAASAGAGLFQPALPFPRQLAAVPEIKGAHHETLDGRGYRRVLKAEQRGLLAGVMAIADIFEALTAADRAYQRGLKLPEAPATMARMVSEQHIDGDLFALFLRSKLFLRYAERHMNSAQIDGVDLDGLLKPSLPACVLWGWLTP